VEGALSDAERTTTIRWFSETVPTRLNNPITSAIVVIMQRLHEGDVSGHIIDEGLGYEHLCLPMRFEPDRKCHTVIGFSDPREEEDELLFPERFPIEVVEREEKAFGGRSSAATAGQFQQRPTPRGGLMFQADQIAVVDPEKVPKMRRIFRYWDKAGTKDGGKRTAGVKMGVDSEGCYWILDVVKGQWAASEREKVIAQTAKVDGPRVRIHLEQEPGSGGKESAENSVKMLAGYAAGADRVTGDKTLRAEPFSCQVAIANVKMVRAEWNTEYLHELRLFPLGKFKDQVDASSGAFNELQGSMSTLEAMAKYATAH
jgi:predicted phage terminase large subunit-like protein